MNTCPTPSKFIALTAIICMLMTSGGYKAAAQEIAPQDLEKMHIMEDSMSVTIDSMYEAFMPESHIGYSERLIRQLVKTLK